MINNTYGIIINNNHDQSTHTHTITNITRNTSLLGHRVQDIFERCFCGRTLKDGQLTNKHTQTHDSKVVVFKLAALDLLLLLPQLHHVLVLAQANINNT